MVPYGSVKSSGAAWCLTAALRAVVPHGALWQELLALCRMVPYGHELLALCRMVPYG